MRKISLRALAAAGLLAGGFASGANAADLGGNCCADLEERVAELEATTVRKGNRKVSLTISGWVAEQVTWWDDGFESNTYVTGLGTTLGTNVKFTGEATIVPGWSAGYVIHIEADGSDSLTTNQDIDNGPGLFAGTPNYVQTLQSFWFLKSDHYGKVGIGLQSSPSDNAAILVDGSGTLVPANWVAFDVLSFGIRNKNGDFVTNGVDADGKPIVVTWGAAGACLPGDCYGVPTNIVRYDTPTWRGFSGSASWGEDDIWDVALRYAGEEHGFKIAATITYGESTDGGTFPGFGQDAQYTQVGVYLQHVRTGIFGLVNYGNYQLDPPNVVHDHEYEHDDYDHDDGSIDSDVWYFKAGVRGKWHPLGATIPYAEYMRSDDGVTGDSEFRWWGVGVVQEIDAAAMSVWLKFRNYEFEDKNLCGWYGCEDLDELTFGGLINF